MRRTLGEFAWLLTFGALAQILTGANNVLHSDTHYLEVASQEPHIWVYFALLGVLNITLAHDLGGRRFGRLMQIACGAVCLTLAGSISFASPTFSSWIALAACATWLIGTGVWLRPGAQWLTLQRSGIAILLGVLLFDLLFDAPFLVLGDSASLALSKLNNVTQHGELVDSLWVPLTMLIIAGTVIRGCIVERTRYDAMLLALFAMGGYLLTKLIDPLEAELVELHTDPRRVVSVVRYIGISHVVSVAVICLALWLLRIKTRRSMPAALGSPVHP
jgi:hypothetical protein